MAEVLEKLREGDIFRWSYRDPGDDRQYGRYHCCSCIAVVHKNGRLYDTFWHGSDNKSFGVEDLPKLELTRLGNFSDLEKAPEYKQEYYDDSDCVNLTHSNSSRDNFYLRKGAQPSAAKMLETARHKLERCESDIRGAMWRAEQLRLAIAKIEAGDLGVHL